MKSVVSFPLKNISYLLNPMPISATRKSIPKFAPCFKSVLDSYFVDSEFPRNQLSGFPLIGKPSAIRLAFPDIYVHFGFGIYQNANFCWKKKLVTIYSLYTREKSRRRFPS